MKALFNLDYIKDIKKEELKFECKNCTEIFLADRRSVKRAIGLLKGNSRTRLDYCTNKCQRIFETKFSKLETNCSNCNIKIIKNKSAFKKSKTGNLFCSKSCSAKYLNNNKKFGTNRSKIEIWIEENLKDRYCFDIYFNNRDILKSGYEIDIYIPSLKLGFEINGIFHYEPIFGEDKLKIIKERDIEKMNECKELEINLIIIDIRHSKKFNKLKDSIYLDFIISELEKYILLMKNKKV
jgi:hypothetical protein